MIEIGRGSLQKSRPNADTVQLWTARSSGVRSRGR